MDVVAYDRWNEKEGADYRGFFALERIGPDSYESPV